MSRRWGALVPPALLVMTIVLVLGCAVHAVLEPVDLRVVGPSLLAFVVVIVAGEVLRQPETDLPITAPISTAAGLGLALSVDVPEPSALLPAGGLVGVTLAVGVGLGTVVRRVLGSPTDSGDLLARLLALLVANAAYRGLPVAGATLAGYQAVENQRWISALVMVLVTAFTAALELTFRGLAAASGVHAPMGAVVREMVGTGFLPLTALISTGAMVALGEQPVSIGALPLFILPLLVTQVAARRYGEIRRTYRETLRSLSMLPEQTGYSRPGHGARVADLATRIGTELALSQRGLADLERAALLHDLGLIALPEPIPDGRTVVATPGVQRLIADEGVHIIRQVGVLDACLPAVETQATPFRVMREYDEPIPLSGRILRVANAFDDFCADADDPLAREQALERLHLGLGYEYDPAVVECLARALEREPTSAPGATRTRPLLGLRL